ncbi:hypothetical protein ATE49_19570 [Elizabethkingia miricola]|uniref:Uncharacterized protein n=1 Tax=Elizabethkingia miricola TaxID=172045 RepID=A0ABD5B1B6_ELIMR|nr:MULTISPECIES: hypothetical protein [Elizabethkingia]MDQ8747709.1 hypothetical protein [Elizabethkingia miricola]NHQ67552.1 hypothetical protein [Elizabethkingia miricola]NHQ71366.1 hypothetical protein [Elizabethkingia miricola]NHQ78770.1 hypothetical protein [Elizabethkingia miricola]OBS14834.1 hypothetical protein ATE49_19570 [Elizabethkingia miricola]
MNKIISVILFCTSLCYAQVIPAVKERNIMHNSNHLRLSDSIHYTPGFSVSIKPVSKDNSWFPEGKMYKDNFTGRTYFQNGYDRTQIYPRYLIIKPQGVNK